MHDWLPKELLIIQGTENKATPVEAEVGGWLYPPSNLASGSMSFVIQDHAKISLQETHFALLYGSWDEDGNPRTFWMTTLIWKVFCQMLCIYTNHFFWKIIILYWVVIIGLKAISQPETTGAGDYLTKPVYN